MNFKFDYIKKKYKNALNTKLIAEMSWNIARYQYQNVYKSIKYRNKLSSKWRGASSKRVEKFVAKDEISENNKSARDLSATVSAN